MGIPDHITCLLRNLYVGQEAIDWFQIGKGIWQGHILLLCLLKLYAECCAVLSCFSHVWLFETPWTVAHQASLSTGVLQARILEWVAMPFSRGSSQPRDWTQVSHVGSGFFTVWVTRETQDYWVGSLSLYPEFSSVTQSCPTLCDPINCSTPGLPVHHQLLEFTQTHVLRVDDAIQPSDSLPSPSLPAPNPSQHQRIFQRVNSSHEVAKVLEFQL